MTERSHHRLHIGLFLLPFVVGLVLLWTTWSEAAFIELFGGLPFIPPCILAIAYATDCALSRSWRLRFRSMPGTFAAAVGFAIWVVFGPAEWATALAARGGVRWALEVRAVDVAMLAPLFGPLLFKKAVSGGAPAAIPRTVDFAIAAALACGVVTCLTLRQTILPLYGEYRVVSLLEPCAAREDAKDIPPDRKAWELQRIQCALATLGLGGPRGPRLAGRLPGLERNQLEAWIRTAEAKEPGRVWEGHVEVSSTKLRAVIADNSEYGPAHRAGYSGIAELYHGGSPRSLFVPAYAGLNFEHVLSGDAASFAWDIFEPRRAAMTLVRTSGNRVELRQERTANWPLKSTISYELSDDDAIDFTIACVPLADAWKKHGYIGLFFASYIAAPEDMAIHFIGRSRPGRGESKPRWIRHVPAKHGEQACHRAVGADWDPGFDEGFKISLASGHSDLEYVYPFYYGVSHGKMLVLMFEKPSKDAETRFAQSPSGGGAGNPAWDFLFLKRGYEVGKEFKFKARVVYRGFAGHEKAREDATIAYEAWSGEKVKRPE